jgi:H+/Cl- antiporter ClcA
MTVTPALGGLGVGIIALKYPGVLYWGFTNVEEILQSGKTASAPGKWLLTQLIAAKVVATSLCKGSGLVGGLYAPSLMIGAAVGSVFGDLAGRFINAAIPGHDAVAHPQAYALVWIYPSLCEIIQLLVV